MSKSKSRKSKSKSNSRSRSRSQAKSAKSNLRLRSKRVIAARARLAKPAKAARPRHKTVFALGDRVAWSSSAAGSTTRKVGVVAEIVAKGASPKTYKATNVRDHVSYVVAVPRVGADGKPILPEAYWPLAALLSGAAGRPRKTRKIELGVPSPILVG